MRINKGLTCVGPLTRLLARQEDTVPDNQDSPELFDSDENGTNALEDQGFSDWPEVSDRMTRWEEAGRLPEACYQAIAGDGYVAPGCDLAEVEVYDIKYDDCEDPWTICRCPNGDRDVERLVTDLGQLPVAARSYVRNVVMSDHMMVDGQSSLEAIALYEEGDIVIYGNWSSVGLFVHETTHLLDFFVAGDGVAPYSDSEEWHDIVDNDTCVADWYSKSAYGEAYAQGAVLLAFDINESGPLDEIVDFDCAAGVHEKLEEQLGAYLKYDDDATCGDRRPKTQDVCMQDNGEALYCEVNEEETEDNSSNNDNGDDNSDDSNGDDDSSNNDDEESSASRPGALAVFGLIAQVLRATGLLSGQ